MLSYYMKDCMEGCMRDSGACLRADEGLVLRRDVVEHRGVTDPARRHEAQHRVHPRRDCGPHTIDKIRRTVYCGVPLLWFFGLRAMV